MTQFEIFLQNLFTTNHLLAGFPNNFACGVDHSSRNHSQANNSDQEHTQIDSTSVLGLENKKVDNFQQCNHTKRKNGNPDDHFCEPS